MGPRPPLPKEVCQYQEWHRRRLDITPGLTCTWQVAGRSQIPFTDWIRMDLRYIRSRSFWQDVDLLLCTRRRCCFGGRGTEGRRAMSQPVQGIPLVEIPLERRRPVQLGEWRNCVAARGRAD